MVYSTSDHVPTWTLIPLFEHPEDNSSSTSGDLSHFATHGNATVFARYPPLLLDLAAATFVLFAAVGAVGNAVTVAALTRKRMRGNATAAFVANLAVADLVFCLTSMPLTAATFLERDWNYGEVLCKAFTLLRYSNAAVSLSSVIAITINRYVLIVHPSLYSTLYRPSSVAVMIALTWLSALALFLPPLVEVWGRMGFDPSVGTCTILKLNGKSPKMALYVVAFGVPSVVFVLCYSRIFCVVRRSSRRTFRPPEVPTLACITTTPKPRRREHKELRVLRVMLVVFVTFVLCYFPASFVKVFAKEEDLPVLNVLGYMGVYFSNIVNPVIYVVMSEEYRKAYMELFCARRLKNGSSSGSA